MNSRVADVSLIPDFEQVGLMKDPALVFTDDLMLDFGSTGYINPLLVDDNGFQDMQICQGNCLSN